MSLASNQSQSSTPSLSGEQDRQKQLVGEPDIEVDEKGEALQLCCFSCTDPLPSDAQLFFKCPLNEKHSLCADCLTNYALSCCDSYMVDKATFPLTCSDPACGCVIPESTVRFILSERPGANQSAWARYLTTWDKAAQFCSINPDEVIVTCPKCNLYSEVFPDSHKKQARCMRAAMKKYLNDPKRQKKYAVVPKVSPFKWQVKSSGYLTRGRPFSAIHSRATNEPRTATPAPTTSTSTTRVSSAKPVLEFSNPRYRSPTRRLQERKVQEKKEHEEKETKEGEKVFANRIPTSLAEQAVVRMVKVEYMDRGVGMTSMFFQCLHRECGAMLCLACNNDVAPDQREQHVCVETYEDKFEDLCNGILKALAEGSSQRCPCGKKWQKSEGCNHMSCTCGQRFCYMCGKSEMQVHGYGMHNSNFTVEVKNRCPMYLTALYGDVLDESTGQRSGGDLRALFRFHLVRQQALIENLRSTTNDEALWNDVVRKYFPKGLLDEKVLEEVQSIQMENALYAEKKEQERKRLKAEQEEKERQQKREELKEQLIQKGELRISLRMAKLSHLNQVKERLPQLLEEELKKELKKQVATAAAKKKPISARSSFGISPMHLLRSGITSFSNTRAQIRHTIRTRDVLGKLKAIAMRAFLKAAETKLVKEAKKTYQPAPTLHINLVENKDSSLIKLPAESKEKEKEEKLAEHETPKKPSTPSKEPTFERLYRMGTEKIRASKTPEMAAERLAALRRANLEPPGELPRHHSDGVVASLIRRYESLSRQSASPVRPFSAGVSSSSLNRVRRPITAFA